MPKKRAAVLFNKHLNQVYRFEEELKALVLICEPNLLQEKHLLDDPFEYSELPLLLERDLWAAQSALLTLSGLNSKRIQFEWSLGRLTTKIIPINNAGVFFSDAIGSEYIGTPFQSESEDVYKCRNKINEERLKMLEVLCEDWYSCNHDVDAAHAPGFFVEWAERRGYEIEWTEWARKRGLIDAAPTIEQPPFFDADSPKYPLLLHIAVRAWEYASNAKGATPKQLVTSYLESRHGSLTERQKKAIALVTNWDPRGGRPKKGDTD